MKDEIKSFLVQIKGNDEWKEIYNHITNLHESEAYYYGQYKDYKSRCEKAIENCKKSIQSINEKLKNNKEPFEVVNGKIIYLNDYQVCRLKAIKMKSKELLNILEGDKDD